MLSDSQLWWPDTALDYHGSACGVRYKLYAVVFHRGATVRTGHYFASVHSTAGTQGHRERGSQRRRRGFWCCGSSAMSDGTFSGKPLRTLLTQTSRKWSLLEFSLRPLLPRNRYYGDRARDREPRSARYRDRDRDKDRALGVSR